MIVTCSICGCEFERRKPTQTCSAACLAELRSRNRAAAWNRHEDPRGPRYCPVCGERIKHPRYYLLRQSCGKSACRAAVRGMHNTPATVEHMVELRSDLPSHAKGEENLASKEWHLRAPDGTGYDVKNLAHFIRTHEALFTARELAHFSGSPDPIAYQMLSALRPGRSRRAESWHGWTWAEG